MCYCTPNMRTPFCDKCPWEMSKELKEIKEKYHKLLSFIKRVRQSAPITVTDGIAMSAFELLKEIGEDNQLSKKDL